MALITGNANSRIKQGEGQVTCGTGHAGVALQANDENKSICMRNIIFNMCKP